MWSYSPGQPEESTDDERSNPRVLRCLQNSGWVWFVCDVKLCLKKEKKTSDMEFWGFL